jgi:hypothetical protein
MAVLGAALIGCSKQPDHLPASTEWQKIAQTSAGAPTDPHAGFAMGVPPAAGAPHGTIGTDVSKLGLPPPDPGRPLDPSHHVRGVIKAAPGLEGRLHEGAAVFVIVKRDDRGTPSGPPLAVQKLTWKAGLSFELTERQAMIGGTQLTGDVIVTARYDQDGDALTKQSGDITGEARVKIPADAVALELATVLP